MRLHARTLLIGTLAIPLACLGTLPAGAVEGADPVVVRVTKADLGNSWQRGCPVKPKKLRAIDINFIHYNGTVQRGRIIVAKVAVKAAREALVAAYDADFRFNSMIPVQAFNSSDNKSMRADNTSGFSCRKLPGTSRWSAHALGQAVDSNPRRNPHVFPNKLLPGNAKNYVQRQPQQLGMVYKNSVITKVFKAHGWTWGGGYRNRDYQHYSRPGHLLRIGVVRPLVLNPTSRFCLGLRRWGFLGGLWWVAGTVGRCAPSSQIPRVRADQI